MDSNTNIDVAQYLFFISGNSKFAVKADNIKEIVDYENITKILISNKAIRGVTNIRGDIIPVVDLNLRFDEEEVQIKKRTSFIIFNIFNKLKQTYSPIALIVDLVIEVEEIEEDDILKAPKFGAKIPVEFIQNIVRFEDKHVVALDIDVVLDIDYLAKIN